MPLRFLHPPKKRTVEIADINDEEMFYRVYDKPTQIYRYLAIHHKISPYFLHRNLSYMFYKNKTKTPKYVDDIALDLRQIQLENTSSLNLNIAGLFLQSYLKNDQNATLNILMNTHDNSSKYQKTIQIASVEIPINPKVSLQDKRELKLDLKKFMTQKPFTSSYLEFEVVMPEEIKLRKKPKRKNKQKCKVIDEYCSEEILVYQNNKLDLKDGMYEIKLIKKDYHGKSTKICTWESFETICKDVAFSTCLRFDLKISPSLTNKRSIIRPKIDQIKKPIVFKIIYKSFSKELDHGLYPKCPWCHLNCNYLYSLLKHLQCCHERFTFQYVESVKCHKIKVTVNENFDGSYSGSPFDYKFNTWKKIKTPVKKYPFTEILAWKPKPPSKSLKEFIDFADLQEQAYAGHRRLYFHSSNGLPMYPNELEYDSEKENDPDWLQTSMGRMLDEFVDVNEGEKELMKMWNIHLLKFSFVGKAQMELACEMFVHLNYAIIKEKKLYRNFLVHLANMVEFDVINAKIMFNVVKMYQGKFLKRVEF